MEKEVEVLTNRLHGELTVAISKEARRRAEEEFKWAVVLRLSSGKSFNAPAMVAAMKKAWNITANLSFQEMAHNKMVVKLSNEEEHKRVMEGGPWTFDIWAVLVEKWKRGASPEDYRSQTIKIWVKIHNIPAEYRDRSIPGELAELAGKVIKDESHDKNKDLKRRKWPRFKIELDVTKPILHGVFLAEDDIKPGWIEYKYERLPLICQKCGRLTHESDQCSFEEEEPPNKRFGPSLKAEVFVSCVPVVERGEDDCRTVEDGSK
ncbi:unnamed protein product [Rhodiola kirilowii]